MSNYEHTTKFKADISSLKSGITQANKELKKIASEYKATSSAAELTGKKQDQLKAKLDYLNKTLEQQNNKLKNYKDQLKTTQTYTDQLSKKEQELTKKLEDAKNKFGENSSQVQKYKQELTNVQKEIQSNKDKMDKLNNTINNQQAICNKTSKELKDLGDNAKNMGYKVSASGDEVKGFGISIDGIDGAVTAASSALNGLGQIVDSLTGFFQNLAINGIQLVIDGMKELTENVFDVGMSFEKRMSLVEAHFGSNLTNGMDDVIAKAEELGANTSKTAEEVAESFDVLAKAGLKSQDAISIMDSIVDLSLGTQEDLTTMTNTLKNALIKFDLEPTVENATHAADLLASASTNADTDVSALGEALGTAGGMAASLGYSLEDTVLALDMMAKYSLNGQEAGTALKRILLNMIDPTEKLESSIEKYGYSLFDSAGNAKELKDVLITLRDVLNDPSLTTESKMYMESLIGGARAIEALSNLVNLSEQDFIDLQDAIYNCDGASKQMATTAQDNMSGSLDILLSAIDGVYLALFGKLGDPARNIIDSLANTFSGLVESIKTGELAPYIDMVANALAGVGEQLPQLIQKHGPEIEKLIQNFCVFLSELIGLLPQLVDVTLPKIIDLLNNLMEKAPGFIEKFAPLAIELIAYLLEHLPTILAILYSLKAIIAVLKTILAGLGLVLLIKKIGSLILSLGKIGALVAKFGGLIAGAGKAIAAFATGPVGIAIAIISAIIGLVVLLYNKCEPFKEFIDNLWNSIKEFLANLWESIKNFSLSEWIDGIGEKLGEMKDNIVNKFTEMKENAINKFIEMKDNIVSFFANLPQTVAYWLGYLIGSVAAWFVNVQKKKAEVFANLLKSIDEFLHSIPDRWDAFCSNMSEKWEKFKENAKEAFFNLLEDIDEFFHSIPDRWTKFYNNMSEKWKKFKESAKEAFLKLCEDIKNKWNEISDFLENIDLKEIGANIIQGFIDGIKSKWENLMNTIKSFGNGIKDGFKDNLDIHSPSRFMRDYIAGNLFKGFEIGIDKNSDSVLKKLSNFNNNIKSSFDFSGLYGANVALAGGYGGSYSNVTNNDSNVTYSPVFNYNKPLSSREIYRQNKNMLSHVLNK